MLFCLNISCLADRSFSRDVFGLPQGKQTRKLEWTEGKFLLVSNLVLSFTSTIVRPLVHFRFHKDKQTCKSVLFEFQIIYSTLMVKHGIHSAQFLKWIWKWGSFLTDSNDIRAYLNLQHSSKANTQQVRHPYKLSSLFLSEWWIYLLLTVWCWW